MTSADLISLLVDTLRRAHACPTVKNDGTCDGCFVSEALVEVASFKLKETANLPDIKSGLRDCYCDSGQCIELVGIDLRPGFCCKLSSL